MAGGECEGLQNVTGMEIHSKASASDSTINSHVTICFNVSLGGPPCESLQGKRFISTACTSLVTDVLLLV